MANSPDPLTRYQSPDTHEKRCLDFWHGLNEQQQHLITTWLKIGNQNQWIAEAWDPPFDLQSFHICQDIHDLADRILHGNWGLGQAYVLGDICFINQVNGGDEWLTIKGQTPFESITMQAGQESLEQAKSRLVGTVKSIQVATEQQCKELKY